MLHSWSWLVELPLFKEYLIWSQGGLLVHLLPPLVGIEVYGDLAVPAGAITPALIEGGRVLAAALAVVNDASGSSDVACVVHVGLRCCVE